MTEEMQKAKQLFKDFCETSGNDTRLEEINWYDMSIGFFISFGLSIDDAEKLAIEVRYKEQYWA